MASRADFESEERENHYTITLPPRKSKVPEEEYSL